MKNTFYFNIVVIIFSFSLSQGCFTQDTLNIVLSGKTINITDTKFELLQAASTGDTTLLEALLSAGVNVNTKSVDGVTPLMYAAQNGHLRAVEILLHHGAAVNALPYNHISALLGAVIAGNVYIADTLIQNGAHINTTDLNRITPLMYAAAFGDTVMVDMLIFYGANVFLKDNYGNTALQYASFYGNYQTVKLLLEHNSDPNSPDNNGFTPLMSASQNGFANVVNLLAKYNANVNSTNDYGLTAIILAIINGHKNAVKVLLENGADPDKEIVKNKNSLYFATKYKNKDIKKLLIANGAKSLSLLSFDIIKPAISIDFNTKDFLGGFGLGVFESKYWLNFEAGYTTRFWVRTANINTDDAILQMWQKRSFTYLAMEKYFLIKKIRYNNYGGLTAGGKIIYTYGSYRGSSLKPEEEIKFTPLFGVFWNSGKVEFKLNYEYLDFDNDFISGNRITFSISLLIGTHKYKEKMKHLPL